MRETFGDVEEAWPAPTFTENPPHDAILLDRARTPVSCVRTGSYWYEGREYDAYDCTKWTPDPVPFDFIHIVAKGAAALTRERFDELRREYDAFRRLHPPEPPDPETDAAPHRRAKPSWPSPPSPPPSSPPPTRTNGVTACSSLPSGSA